MNEHDYAELFRLIGRHVDQPNMTAREKAEHLEAQARKMGATAHIDGFLAQWQDAMGEWDGDE